MVPGEPVLKHLFCFGLGFSGQTLGARLLEQGWIVSGTSRTVEGASRLRARGFAAHVFDGNRPEPAIAQALQSVSHLLLSIAPDAHGDPALRCHGADIAEAPSLAWIGYLSTIGVYGDRQGAWVDETAAVTPGTERSIRRADAEKSWLDFGRETGQPIHLFRLAGIYGPGRSAIDNIKDGNARRIVKAGQVFNRIHVADIAGVMEASMARPRAGAAYNVTDNEPAPPQDVVAYAAELLGVAPPPEIPFAGANLSPMGRSFYGENKRVSNALIKRELGVQLRYPTYREGLRSLLKA